MNPKAGQSVLEYVIMLTFIIAAFVFAGRLSSIKPAVETMVKNSGSVVSGASDRVFGNFVAP